MSKVKKLSGEPYETVAEWYYEKKLKRKKDAGLPLKGDNIREDTEKEEDVNKTSETLQGLVFQLNNVIEEVLKIPELEKRIDELEVTLEEAIVTLEESIAAVETALDDHSSQPSSQSHASAGGTGTDTSGGRKGGVVRDIKRRGGRIR